MLWIGQCFFCNSVFAFGVWIFVFEWSESSNATKFKSSFSHFCLIPEGPTLSLRQTGGPEHTTLLQKLMLNYEVLANSILRTDIKPSKSHKWLPLSSYIPSFCRKVRPTSRSSHMGRCMKKHRFVVLYHFCLVQRHLSHQEWQQHTSSIYKNGSSSTGG